MKDMEWSFTDKSEWGPGLWQEEPDKMQFVDKETGFACLIVRGPHGALCGYVGVGKDHPYYQKHYGDVDIEVHWGLTYSDFCVEEGKEHGICHITEPGDEDPLWWLGFDCAHCDDICPSYQSDWKSPGSSYKSMTFVKSEIMDVAKQLAEATQRRQPPRIQER